MPAPYSTAYQAHLQRVTRDEGEVILLEITHADLVTPIRVCNDKQNVVSGGNTFVATSFMFQFPEDRERQTPRAQLAFTNVGRDLMQWLEQANGGEGALCRVRLVRRSLPNNVELDLTVGLQGVVADPLVVTAELGYEALLDRAAVQLRYDANVAPGVF